MYVWVSANCPLCVHFPFDYLLLDNVTETEVLFCPLGGNNVYLAGEQGNNGQYLVSTVSTLAGKQGNKTEH